VLIYLVVVPLLLLLLSSFRPEGLPLNSGFTLANYAEAYLGPDFLPLLWNTVSFAIGATLTALAFGTVLAWLAERTDLPARAMVRAMIILPMATPPVLLAIGWTILLSPRIGFFNDILMALFGLNQAPLNIYSLWGMIFVEGLSLTPSTFLMLSPVFRNMDPNLEEAALVSGAGTWKIIRRILLPIMRPALLAATVFLVIVCFVVFDIPGTIGVPGRIFVLSSKIYYMAHHSATGLPEYGYISALAVLFLAILFVLGWTYQHLTRQAQRFVTITGKGYRARPFRLHKWRYPALGLVCLYFTLGVLAPLAVLIWTSLMPYNARVSVEMLSHLTLDNHIHFLSNRLALEATGNSVTIAFTAATVVTLLSAFISWVIIRTRTPGRRFLDILSFAPVAIPGVMLGMALVYVYLTIKGLHIYGTIWIIAIAYITYYMSYGSRATRGVMVQMHPELEEAGRTCGASWPRVLRKITVPLLAPGLFAVWIWVVAHAMRELSSALMLQGLDNTVISTLLWEYWSGGELNKAAAVGVWLILALLLVVTVWQVSVRRSQLRVQ